MTTEPPLRLAPSKTAAPPAHPRARVPPHYDVFACGGVYYVPYARIARTGADAETLGGRNARRRRNARYSRYGYPGGQAVAVPAARRLGRITEGSGQGEGKTRTFKRFYPPLPRTNLFFTTRNFQEKKTSYSTFRLGPASVHTTSEISLQNLVQR